MAADKTLAKAGLYFDELNKIRVLEPEVAQQTTELRDECKGFIDSKLQFALVSVNHFWNRRHLIWMKIWVLI